MTNGAIQPPATADATLAGANISKATDPTPTATTRSAIFAKIKPLVAAMVLLDHWLVIFNNVTIYEFMLAER